MKNKTMKYVSRAVAFLLGMLLLLSLVPMSVMASEVDEIVEELPVDPYAEEPESDPIPEGGLLPEGWIPLDEPPNEGNDWIQGIPDGSISMGDHATLGGGEQASINSIFSNQKEDLPTVESASMIVPGMTFFEVDSIIGYPQRQVTFGLIVMEYDLKNNGTLRIEYVERDGQLIVHHIQLEEEMQDD